MAYSFYISAARYMAMIFSGGTSARRLWILQKTKPPSGFRRSASPHAPGRPRPQPSPRAACPCTLTPPPHKVSRPHALSFHS